MLRLPLMQYCQSYMIYYPKTKKAQQQLLDIASLQNCTSRYVLTSAIRKMEKLLEWSGSWIECTKVFKYDGTHG